MGGENILPEIGNEFGNYRIISELGRGNNGVVYLAEQQPLDREVALKVLLPEHSRNAEYVQLLMNEARAAARMCHPNIVQALDAGTIGGCCFLAMEYVRGRTLEHIRIESPEIISFEFLVGISIQLADALDYAWNNFQLTHGDIKPENLLISDDGRTLKLADLGLAHVSGRVNSDDGSIMATPMYVAPEVVSGSGGGVRSDIYSFGVMFYELIAGEPPFRGNTETLLRCHLEVPAPPLSSVNPDVPPELAEFTDRMLAKSPDDRPQSWQEVKSFLEEFRDRRFRTAKPATAPEPEQKKRSGESPLPRILLGVAFAVLGVGALVAVVLMVWLLKFRA
ncbi:MAG: serine/threonine protein kinase [Lentisphaeria bacterium]|nr:serine/threonine protein kinase [Lentisphaeria bacterium]